MTGVVHLARFGNQAGAHNLLEHTGADESLLTKIVWHTDAPPSSPSVIEPFISGYPFDDFYIVQITKPDDTANRPGMVSTTAAIVAIPMLADLDLYALLAKIADTGPALKPLEEIPVIAVDPHKHPPGAGALASALLAKGRAAWIGPGLANAIGCVWSHIAQADRARVVFGAAFHPDAGLSVPTSSGSIVIITVPNRIASRWTNWTTVSAESGLVADVARDALFDDDDGRATRLANNLGIANVMFTQWRHVAAADEFLERVATLDHESTRALLQLLGYLQPAAALGEGPKQAAVGRLAEISPTVGYNDIRGLRGVPWDALPPAPALTDLLHSWARATLPNPHRGSDFVDAVCEAEAGDPFGQILNVALQEAASLLAISAAVESALRHPRGAEVVSWLARHTSSRADLDAELAHAVQAVDIIPDWVEAAAASQRLPRTHAAVAETSDPVVAWRRHLRIVPRTKAADDILAKRIGDIGTVHAAIQSANKLLTDRAGRLVAAQPSLLPKGDISDNGFRSVWAAAIRHGAGPWLWFSPAEAVGPLLTLATDGEQVDQLLLDKLSQTSAADVSNYERRARLWDRLPPEISTRFRDATAAAFARSLRPGDPAPERPLQIAILAPGVLGAVAHEGVGQALTILRTLPAVGTEHVELVASRGRFRRHEAADLARLVIERGWTRAAGVIVDLAGNRPDLQVAAKQVAQLFSTLERIRRFIGFGGSVRDLASVGELRDALHDLAVDLYPDGPTQGALWDRAGGNDADLPAAITGRHRWGLALEAVRRGQHGAPTLKALLKAMAGDFPNNSDLDILAQGLQERKKDDRKARGRLGSDRATTRAPRGT